MFTNPIKRTRITTMEDLLNSSFMTRNRSNKFCIKCECNKHIAFSDEFGRIWVTPYRQEIHLVLSYNGYKNGELDVPFSDTDEVIDSYKWLIDIANQENWATTYEKAFEYASEKGIKPVDISTHPVQIREIRFWYDDTKSHKKYYGMIDQFLRNGSEKNIATYIIVDEKTILICDEYGRTFLVKVKIIINDIVNALIDAGYKRTLHPERYVYTLK